MNKNEKNVSLHEMRLKEKFADGIKEYTKILIDTPKIPCVSCERLHCMRSLKLVKNFDDRLSLIDELSSPNQINYWRE